MAPPKLLPSLLLGLLPCLVAIAPLRADDPLAARKAELETLSADQKNQLLEKKERFEQLPPTEQDKMRGFHSRLEAADDGQRLRTVLERYHEWLKTLPAGQRADLLAMPESERVEAIKKIRSEQEAQRFRRIAGTKLTQEDLKAVQEWTHEFVQKKQAELLATMPADMRSRFEQSQDQQARRRMLFGAMMWQRGEHAIRPGPEEIEKLMPLLSAEARKALKSVTDPEKQAQLVRSWAVGNMMNRWTPPQQVSDEELTRFYQHDLDAGLREQLESLPRDQLFQELRRLYFARQEWRRPGGPGGPGGSGRPNFGQRGDGRDGPGRSDGPGRNEGPGRGDGHREGPRRGNGKELGGPGPPPDGPGGPGSGPPPRGPGDKNMPPKPPM